MRIFPPTSKRFSDTQSLRGGRRPLGSLPDGFGLTSLLSGRGPDVNPLEELSQELNDFSPSDDYKNRLQLLDTQLSDSRADSLQAVRIGPINPSRFIEGDGVLPNQPGTSFRPPIPMIFRGTADGAVSGGSVSVTLTHDGGKVSAAIMLPVGVTYANCEPQVADGDVVAVFKTPDNQWFLLTTFIEVSDCDP